MPSTSLAFEALTYAERIPSEAPAQATRPLAEAPLDSEYYARAEYYVLLEEIRKHEGEIVENPPLLFKITVVVGFAMTAAGVVGLGLGIARLASWLL